MGLDQKVVVVTGGASGIGLAIAQHFASLNYAVHILDVNDETGHEAARKLGQVHEKASVTFHTCNVASWDQLTKCFDDIYNIHGQIDIVMPNAGVSGLHKKSWADVDSGDGDEKGSLPEKPDLTVLDINLTGMIYTTRLAVHYMSKIKMDSNSPRGGKIICTASCAGLWPYPAAPLYATSKYAVTGFVRSLARPLSKLNIQINAVAPAVMATNITPDPRLYSHLHLTPYMTLIRAIDQLLIDGESSTVGTTTTTTTESPTGEIIILHGDDTTVWPVQECIDAETADNFEMIWKLTCAARATVV